MRQIGWIIQFTSISNPSTELEVCAHSGCFSVHCVHWWTESACQVQYWGNKKLKKGPAAIVRVRYCRRRVGTMAPVYCQHAGAVAAVPQPFLKLKTLSLKLTKQYKSVWPSGLRRWLQVPFYFGRRGFEPLSGQMMNLFFLHLLLMRLKLNFWLLEPWWHSSGSHFCSKSSQLVFPATCLPASGPQAQCRKTQACQWNTSNSASCRWQAPSQQHCHRPGHGRSNDRPNAWRNQQTWIIMIAPAAAAGVCKFLNFESELLKPERLSLKAEAPSHILVWET